jgi:uncharacterized Tic20 family protein
MSPGPHPLPSMAFSVMGAVAANKGDSYKYPLAIPFFS